MKKLLAVILSVGMLLSLCACGGDKNNEQTNGEVKTESKAETEAENKTETKKITKEEYEKMTADDLLKGIKDKKNVTPEEYAAVVETLEFVTIKDNFELEKNITDEALKTIKNEAEKFPKVSAWVKLLWNSEVPQVKGRALINASPAYSDFPELLTEAEESLKTEQDPYIIYCTLKGLPSVSFDKEEIITYVQNLVNHENTRLSQYANYLLETVIK